MRSRPSRAQNEQQCRTRYVLVQLRVHVPYSTKLPLIIWFELPPARGTAASETALAGTAIRHDSTSGDISRDHDVGLSSTKSRKETTRDDMVQYEHKYLHVRIQCSSTWAIPTKEPPGCNRQDASVTCRYGYEIRESNSGGVRSPSRRSLKGAAP